MKRIVACAPVLVLWAHVNLAADPIQIVTPDPVTQVAAGGDVVILDVDYTTEDPFDETLAGLGLRLHYDSSQLESPSLTDVLPTSKLSEQIGLPDTGDDDSDPDTDMFILVAWSDPFDSMWLGPGTLPARLYTANFVAADGFSGTTLNFSASSTSPGNSLSATSAQIDPVPEPSALLLLAVGLVGLLSYASRRGRSPSG